MQADTTPVLEKSTSIKEQELGENDALKKVTSIINEEVELKNKKHKK